MRLRNHFIAISVLYSATAASGQSIDPSLVKPNAEYQISKEYLPTLRIKGKTGAEVINSLTKENFICGMNLGYQLPGGPRLPPSISCRQYPSHVNENCEKLDLTIKVAWDGNEGSRSDMLKQLDAVHAVSAIAFCPYTISLVQHDAGEKKAGERSLSDYLASLHLVGNTMQDAIQLALQEGFQCGFSYGDIAESEKEGNAEVVCAMQPTRIKYCEEPTLRIVSNLREPSALRATRFLSMGAVKVESLQSNCGNVTGHEDK